MAKKPCAKCGGPITHPQLAGDASELCENCAPADTADTADTGGTAATPTDTYRCWVRVKRPKFYKEWSQKQRKAAVAEVKRLVREKGGEGCVESRDERRPFETYWARVRGKLIETAFY
jgi:reverse gyrase